MDPNLDKILSKVKKLLKLAAKAGTKEEAETAAAMAQTLITRHKLEVSSLADSDGEETNDKHVPLYASRKMVTWKSVLGAVLAKHNSCKTYTNKVQDPRDGRRVISATLCVIGTKSNVEILRYMFDSTSRLIDNGAKAALKKQQEWTYIHEPKIWSGSYRMGMIEGIRLKLLEGEQKLRQEYAGTQALMRLDQQMIKAEDAFKQIPGVQPAKNRINQNQDAYAAGVRAGRQAQLHKGVSGGTSGGYLKG